MLGLPAMLGRWPPHLSPASWALHPDAGLHQNALNFWTCAWLHANTAHLFANLVGLSLIVCLGWILKLAPQAAIAWALAWPLTHVALLLDTRLSTYYGLSGVLHAGLGIIATSLILDPSSLAGKWTKPFGWALLGGLFVKCWLDNPHWQALVPRPELAMNAAPMSHWAGALVGMTLTVPLTLLLTKYHRCSKSRP